MVLMFFRNSSNVGIKNEETNIIAQICDIIAVEVDPDRLDFDSESIRKRHIWKR